MTAVSHQHARPTTPEAIMDALAAPFEGNEIRVKPGVVSGNRALAIPYIDARAIQDRLDEVVGLINWQDEYECLPDGSVICRLRVRIGGEWICKVDVGGQSEQPDEGDRRKAAFSDALKRAAVKFGIGRYLYRQPAQWQDYDPARKQFARPVQQSGSPSGTSFHGRREAQGREQPRMEPPKGEPAASGAVGMGGGGPRSLPEPRSYGEARRPAPLASGAKNGAP